MLSVAELKAVEKLCSGDKKSCEYSSVKRSLNCTGWHKKTGTFEKPNKNWRNPRKKMYWQKMNHYNLPF